MEFKEAMRIWKRMCAAHKTCSKCGMATCDPAMCRPWVWDNPVKAEAILAKWAAEHPERTRLDDFLDKHPRAPLDDNDTPRACAKHLGYCAECMSSTSAADCDDCWRQPLEEVEG